MDELNSRGNHEFPNDQLSTADRRQEGEYPRDKSPELAADDAGEVSGLSQELEQACLSTGATGAAIALVRGERIVCYATAGSHVPDIGAYLDPCNGLSGACIRTRQFQQCNDTQLDPRVDRDACRDLGVRSIVVLPLIDGEQLFGIIEILSSRANAFTQTDLETLQVLTDGMVESRRQKRETIAATPCESASLVHNLEAVVPTENRFSLVSEPGFPQRGRISDDAKAAMLSILVIALAILLGALVGLRLGWQQATLGSRTSLRHYRANFKSKTIGNDHVAFPYKEIPPSSVVTDECGPALPAGSPVQSSVGGLTVCQEGRLIFRLPPSAPHGWISQRLPSLGGVGNSSVHESVKKR